jgi:para-nitrobenzyl esterase
MAPPETTVATRSGSVRGVAEDGLLVWRGIPFAAPPIGPLRFRPPQPVLAWSGVRAAVEAPARAWQSEDSGLFATPGIVLPEVDEDCLFLNVSAPDVPAPPGGYPVLVWIHGGGYTRGSGSGGVVADGAALAARGVVVVSVNYRLGAFGFLALADVLGAIESESGAVGLYDQIAALQWVAANIAAFGGDPGRVTIYGVSAGGKSIANLLASPLASGLVHRAISASGGEYLADINQGIALRRRLFAELGLREDDAALVRDVPAKDLLDAQEAIASGASGTWVWRPSRTARVLPRSPIEAIALGAATGIDLLVGHNGNEGATYQALDPTAAAQAPRVLAELFGTAAAGALLDGYAQARPDLDDVGIALAVLGDERYAISTHRLAQAQTAHANVYRYRFDSMPPGMPAELAGGHGMDMAMIWGADRLAPRDSPQSQLAQTMVDYWAQFIRGTPPWERYERDAQLTMILTEESGLESAPRAAQTALWDGRSWQPSTWWSIAGVS